MKCTSSGVIGEVIKFYKPTACEEQTLVRTDDGRQYHAPTKEWVIVNMEADLVHDAVSNAAASVLRETMRICVNGKHETVYKDDVERELTRSLYEGMGLNYGA